MKCKECWYWLNVYAGQITCKEMAIKDGEGEKEAEDEAPNSCFHPIADPPVLAQKEQGK